jgi:adenosine deaminase
MYAYLEKAHADGVRRSELFFDPQTHTHRGVGFDVFMPGFASAMERAATDFGISAALILCFLRHLPADDAMKTWEEAQKYVQNKSIVSVGLDSSEKDFPPALFKPVFEKAGAAGMRLVAHAGEEGPPEYVIAALDALKVERVDHGVRAEEDPVLMQRLVDTQIPLTVCPFSNLALKVVERLEDHNIKRLLDKGLAVSINSDDPAYFGGYIAENYRATAQALGLTRDEVVRIARISLQSTFSPESDKQKWLEELDNYVRQANKQLLEEEGVTVETTVESETIALEDEVAA